MDEWYCNHRNLLIENGLLHKQQCFALLCFVSPVSPVPVESTKTTKMQPKRLLKEHTHHVTSVESLRTMALREISKVRAHAEKEKQAKQKFLGAAETSYNKSSKSKKKV